MKRNTVYYKNTSLDYFTCGNGKPVLLMHGFAEDHSIWKNQIEHLSKSYFIIAPDLFGTGSSSFLEEKEIQIEDYAKGIKQILMAENITRFSMFGHSMGGYITLAYFELFPEDLISFGLVHSTAYADDTHKIEIRNKAIQFIQKNGSPSFLKTSIPALFYNPEKYQQEIKSLVNIGEKISSAYLIQYYEAMKNRQDKTALIQNTKTPVLFIAGNQDQAIPLARTLQQCHLPEMSVINILKNTSHMGMLENPESVNHILSFFLTNLSEITV